MGAFRESHTPMVARTAKGTHDPLFVHACAISDDTTTLVLCSADILSFQWIDVDAIRNTFAEQTDLPAENLILCGTHNHNGPECTYHFGGSPDADPYPKDPPEYNRACVTPGTGERWIDETATLLEKLYHQE